ncbi:hypothetical protein FQA47_006008 [Oryzias melastigma]|uniref:Uncharacterized protein n=1 Tax=Oryzias melastigma TaxID=30732 RepID=A0A834C405_ORYME|nr:hypothetical protein FQA47_006008 [Oryzias melastigma]
MFQSVEKDEATQAIICTILSASNTSLWRLLLKRLFRKRTRRAKRDVGGWGGEESGEKSWLEKMERDSSVWCSMLFTFFFLEDYGVSRVGGTIPPLTVWLPVRVKL